MVGWIIVISSIILGVLGIILPFIYDIPLDPETWTKLQIVIVGIIYLGIPALIFGIISLIMLIRKRRMKSMEMDMDMEMMKHKRRKSARMYSKVYTLLLLLIGVAGFFLWFFYPETTGDPIPALDLLLQPLIVLWWIYLLWGLLLAGGLWMSSSYEDDCQEGQMYDEEEGECVDYPESKKGKK
jgi:FtsH-binding integral membrane protein